MLTHLKTLFGLYITVKNKDILKALLIFTEGLI